MKLPSYLLSVQAEGLLRLSCNKSHTKICQSLSSTLVTITKSFSVDLTQLSRHINGLGIIVFTSSSADNEGCGVVIHLLRQQWSSLGRLPISGIYQSEAPTTPPALIISTPNFIPAACSVLPQQLDLGHHFNNPSHHCDHYNSCQNRYDTGQEGDG